MGSGAGAKRPSPPFCRNPVQFFFNNAPTLPGRVAISSTLKPWSTSSIKVSCFFVGPRIALLKYRFRQTFPDRGVSRIANAGQVKTPLHTPKAYGAKAPGTRRFQCNPRPADTALAQWRGFDPGAGRFPRHGPSIK